MNGRTSLTTTRTPSTGWPSQSSTRASIGTSCLTSCSTTSPAASVSSVLAKPMPNPSRLATICVNREPSPPRERPSAGRTSLSRKVMWNRPSSPEVARATGLRVSRVSQVWLEGTVTAAPATGWPAGSSTRPRKRTTESSSAETAAAVAGAGEVVAVCDVGAAAKLAWLPASMAIVNSS